MTEDAAQGQVLGDAPPLLGSGFRPPLITPMPRCAPVRGAPTPGALPSFFGAVSPLRTLPPSHGEPARNPPPLPIRPTPPSHTVSLRPRGQRHEEPPLPGAF